MTSPAAPIGIQRRQLGNELRKLRELAGLTQEQAAESLGKAANKISRVENGKVGITKTDLDELLRLYKASGKDTLWCRELASGARRRRTRAAANERLVPLEGADALPQHEARTAAAAGGQLDARRLRRPGRRDGAVQLLARGPIAQWRAVAMAPGWLSAATRPPSAQRSTPS